ncbi:hypothetical protein DFH06DRAFT_129998 [Mycena polygramma]|nr:hypothetical protein DFH06DRAFT_129998 [Mycena polygramma]
MDRMDPLSGLLPETPGFELQAKSLIAVSQTQIARLESQIWALQGLLAEEHGVLTRLRAAIAPIRKLPTELLAEIFLQVHNRGDSKKHYWMSHLTSRSPLGECKAVHALSQVCSHWRRVAHATPRLWTEHMKILLDESPTATYIARAKECLERSAPWPIPVSLHCPGTDAKTKPLVDVLVTAAHRWSAAEFALSSLSALSHIPDAQLSCLKKLHLESTDVSCHAKIQAFLTAHRLRDVTLSTRCTPQLLIPWSQLTTIDVTDPSPWDCLNTLVQCTSIVAARFQTSAWATPPDLSERQITTLGRLEDLSVCFGRSESDFIAPFFARLALPSLKKLFLGLQPDIVWQSQEFTQFQLRCPEIEKLTISNSGMTADDLMAILRYASSLIELDMRESPLSLDDSLLTGLRYSETDAAPLAPRLETLSFTDAGRNFEDHALDATIQSRWWTDDQIVAFSSARRVSRWLSIYITCGEEEDEMDPKFKAKLETYRSQGLDVNMYSGYGD